MTQQSPRRRYRPQPWHCIIAPGAVALLLIAGVIVACHPHPKPTPTPTPTPTPAPVSFVDVPTPTTTPTSVPTPTACHAHGALPDPACTPGATDPRVTQGTIHQTICQAGYTKTVRPPVDVTSRIKQERMAAYDVSGPAADYELDHEVSLELGGDPLALANLWPEAAEPRPGFHEKDHYENYLHHQVCSGAMTLADAQKQIETDWLSGWKAVGQP